MSLNGQQILLRNVNRIFLGGFFYFKEEEWRGEDIIKEKVSFVFFSTFSFRQSVFFNEKLQIRRERNKKGENRDTYTHTG